MTGKKKTTKPGNTAVKLSKVRQKGDKTKNKKN